MRWRTAEHDISPYALFLSSPYNIDAHLGRKRTTKWIGYKAHMTETCDDGKPHLITHVQTMAAPGANEEATTPAHTALRAQGLLPAVHLVDTGYRDAELLVATRQDFGIDLAGPARADERWQARAGKGFAVAGFNVDWERKDATCPWGARSANGHVENRLHSPASLGTLPGNGSAMVLDAASHKNLSRLRSGMKPQDMATVRHMAMGLLRGPKHKHSLKVRREPAAWDIAYLEALLRRPA